MILSKWTAKVALCLIQSVWNRSLKLPGEKNTCTQWIQSVLIKFSTCCQNKHNTKRPNDHMILLACYWSSGVSRKAYWVSHIDGESRWALFTEDTALPVKVDLPLSLLPGACTSGRVLILCSPLFLPCTVREPRCKEASSHRSVRSAPQHTSSLPHESQMYRNDIAQHIAHSKLTAKYLE